MARAYDTDALINRVEHYTLMPANQGVFSDENIVDILNEEISEYIVPFLLSYYEDYLVTSTDITLVANTAAYDLPTDAVADKVKDVKLAYSDGTEISIPRIHTSTKGVFVGSFSDPIHFEIRGNQIRFPTPTASVPPDPVVRVYYYQRPCELVSSADYAIVGQVAGPQTLEYAASVTTASQIYQAATLSVQKANPFYSYLVDGSAVSGSGSGATVGQVTFTAADLSAVLVGDYVVPEGKCAIPQIPRELISLLCVRTAITLLRARGLMPLTQELEVKAAQIEDKLSRIFRPRVDGETPVVFNSNNPLRALKQHTGWWRR